MVTSRQHCHHQVLKEQRLPFGGCWQQIRRVEEHRTVAIHRKHGTLMLERRRRQEHRRQHHVRFQP